MIKRMGRLLLLLFLVHQSSAVIYHLNITEFNKMPELYHLDEYDACIAEPGGTYCLIDAVLYSKDGSDLMRMIQEYSEQKIKHYNHSVVHRAYCVQKTCKNFIGNRSLDKEEDLKAVLEDCVDNSMWTGYKLNARLKEVEYCKRYGQKLSYDTGDLAVAGVYLVLIILNAVGTSYDIINGDTAGNPYLLAFSLRRNWRKLIAPSGNGPDSRLNRFKMFNGLRSITMICVFFSHTALVYVFTYLKNPRYVEMSYDEPAKYILLNGQLVTYTFFVMSGFLLAFNLELQAEKHRLSLWEWPKGMLLRWLRLTPVYALIIFTIMTINRHFGDGPLWDRIVTSESTACSQYWWAHVLYINNYLYDDSLCFPQSWYLAADTQLFALGLLICILCRKPRTQMLVLAGMMVVSLGIPAAYVYFLGVNAVVIQAPEVHRSLFQFDDTFRLTFVAAHTNMSTYVLGIAAGLLTYHWFKNEKKVSERLRRYRWVMWLSFPIGVGTILSGAIFYVDDYNPSIIVKTVYAAVYRPIFQLFTVIIIMACIFKVETVFRGILEWRGFTWTARASYGGFLLHSIFQRALMGSQRALVYMSDYNILTILASTMIMTTSAGAILFLTVESPLNVITKQAFVPSRRSRPQEPAVEDSTKDFATKEDSPKDVTTKV